MENPTVVSSTGTKLSLQGIHLKDGGNQHILSEKPSNTCLRSEELPKPNDAFLISQIDNAELPTDPFCDGDEEAALDAIVVGSGIPCAQILSEENGLLVEPPNGASNVCNEVIFADPSDVDALISEETDVKKVDEWLKSRGNDYLSGMGLAATFGSKGGSEVDLFEAAVKDDVRNSVIDLFSDAEKAVLSNDVNTQPVDAVLEDLAAATAILEEPPPPAPPDELVVDSVEENEGGTIDQVIVAVTEVRQDIPESLESENAHSDGPSEDPVDMIPDPENDSLENADDPMVTETAVSLTQNEEALLPDQAFESLTNSGLDFSTTERPEIIGNESHSPNTNASPPAGVTPNTQDISDLNSAATDAISIAAGEVSESDGATIRLLVTTANGQQQLIQISGAALVQSARGGTLTFSPQVFLNPETVLQSGQLNVPKPCVEIKPVVTSSKVQSNESKPVVVSKANSTTYPCPIPGCDKVFNKECNLRVHSMTHVSSRPFKCPFPECAWAFSTEYKLKRHYKTHQGMKEYVCNIDDCNRCFTTIYNLNTHKKLHNRPSSFPCPVEKCPQSFQTKKNLDSHLKEHEEMAAPYRCPEPNCGRALYSANSIASHIRVHEGKRECMYCGKVFERICKLKQHERQHTGERPYVCEHEGCGWRFISASKLTRHMKKHTGERKYHCSEPGCGKSFMRLEHLKGHEIVHSGSKPFNCHHEGCESSFAAKSSLYVHLKKHRNSQVKEKPVYPCPMQGCVKKFNGKATLRAHLLKNHYSVLNKKGTESSLMLEEFQLQEVDDVQQEFITAEPLSEITSTDNLYSNSEVANSIMGLILSEDSLKPEVLVTPIQPDVGEGEVPLINTVLESGGVTTPLVSEQNLELISTTGVLQENHSGSARTDYCSNRLYSSQAKKRRQLKLALRSLGAKERKSEPNGVTLPCTDVVLASSAVTLKEPGGGMNLVQTPLIQDDSQSSDMYPDSILSSIGSAVSLVPDLTVPVALLSDHTTTELGTTIHLQEIE